MVRDLLKWQTADGTVELPGLFTHGPSSPPQWPQLALRPRPATGKDGRFRPRTASSHAAVGPDVRIHSLIPLRIAALSGGARKANRPADTYTLSR